MARHRHRHRSPLRIALPIALLVAGAYAAWRYGPAFLAGLGSAPDAPPSVDVCGAVPAARVATLFGAAAVEARAVGAGAGVPAAGACTWSAGSTQVVALAFTAGSLAAAGPPATFYASTLTGIEYEMKDVPRTLPGLGDEAALAGFSGDAPRSGRLVARRGALVIELAGEDTSADALRAIAAALLAAP